ncbi:MAG: hypothetical protein IK130_03460 [Oscillospiraceae bacterium]|nr:hypothetical protein [Oscillospiraceae bacterium]
MRKMTAAVSALLLCAMLTGCRSARGGETAAQTAAETTAVTTTVSTTSATTTTTTTVSTSLTTSSETTETTSDTSGTESTSSVSTKTTAANPDGKDVKILWSERGLEALPAAAEGYGEPLTQGSDYLGWTLENYSGTPRGNSLSAFSAEFSRKDPVTANGILTAVTGADSSVQLSLRVDNQADFPYFPADTKERGQFIVSDKDALWKMLKQEGSPSASTSIAVTVSIDRLTIRLGDKQNEISVTSASTR